MRSFPKFEKELLKGIHVSEDHPQYNIYRDYGLNRFFFGKSLIELISPFVKECEMHVLDIGCGNGGISAAFSDSGIRIVSTEYDLNYKNLIKYIFDDIGAKPALFCADGHNLPFSARKFNVVLAIDLLEHMKDLRTFIKELSRVTSDEGIICLTLAERYSWQNIKRDPHYGLFGVILLPRFLREFIVVRLTKRNPTLDDYYWIKNFRQAFELFKKEGILLKEFNSTVLGLKVSQPIIDVGSQKDCFFLSIDDMNPDSGWFECEEHPGFTQRWTKKRAGGFIMIPSGATRFNIELSSCNPETMKIPTRCSVFLNRSKIGKFILSNPKWCRITLNIPFKFRNDCINRFDIVVDKTWVPAEVTGTLDQRELGVAIRSIGCE